MIECQFELSFISFCRVSKITKNFNFTSYGKLSPKISNLFRLFWTINHILCKHLSKPTLNRVKRTTLKPFKCWEISVNCYEISTILFTPNKEFKRIWHLYSRIHITCNLFWFILMKIRHWTFTLSGTTLSVVKSLQCYVSL